MKKLWVVLMLAAASSAFGQAQVSTLESLDPMKRTLLEPVMALHYGDEIGLSRQQRVSIEQELRLARAEFSNLQRQLEREMLRLHELLEQPELQEQQATAQLDRILDLERRIKRLNLLCALRVRGQLNGDQRQKLQALELPPPPPPPHVTVPHPPGPPRAPAAPPPVPEESGNL